MEPERNYKKFTCIFSAIIAVCSILTFVVILILALVLAPKTVRLINSAQKTLDNMETVSENLKDLNLSATIDNIDENTARAMRDVSDSMKQLDELDTDTLNQSIQDLSKSVEELRKLINS